MSKPRGACIFCGRGGLTKEHTYPEWIQKILPKKFITAGHEITRPLLPSGTRLPVHPSYRPIRQGDPLVRKLRVVCGDCNSGWMSRLQIRAKPHLAPLLRPGWQTPGPEVRATLAAWAAMTAAVKEFADPPTAFSTAADRRFLMDLGVPPISWIIWMGRFTGEQDRMAKHTAFSYYRRGEKESVSDKDRGFLSSMRIGSVVFFVLRMPEGNSIPGLSHVLGGDGLDQLWPPGLNNHALDIEIDDNAADDLHRRIMEQVHAMWYVKGAIPN